jgi:hypothetical protein
MRVIRRITFMQDKQIMRDTSSLLLPMLTPYLGELLAVPDFKRLQNLFPLLLCVSMESEKHTRRLRSLL